MTEQPASMPLSEASRLDQKIRQHVHRIFSGKNESGDMTDLGHLIRERAELFMPSSLRYVDRIKSR